MSKKNSQDHGTAEEIESALTRTEQFIENNQKIITTVVVSIIAIVGIYLLFTKVYLKNREQAARSQMYVAEKYFRQDSFKRALNGDGNYPGMLRIMEDYSFTQSADLARYYSGISYLNLGQYDKAIQYLKDFSSGDVMVAPVAKGAIGDAYMEKGNIREALNYYMKAANMRDNNLTTPIYLKKAGMAYEEVGDYQEAIEAYERIKLNYPNSQEARSVDKYIARAKIKQDEES